MDSHVHSTIGFSIVELQSFDNKAILVVMEERLPKSKHCIMYGLILDLSKLSVKQYQSLTTIGYMFFLEDRMLWTLQHVQKQWDKVDKARCESVHVALVPV